jgi:hypothetical protein
MDDFSHDYIYMVEKNFMREQTRERIFDFS